jgi:hypothetical protein
MFKTLNNNFEYNKLLLRLYFSRFCNNKTVFICSWPTYKLVDPKDKDSINLDKKGNELKVRKNAKIIDEFRRNLILHNYYVEALSTHNLRRFGFNVYGPIVSIASEKEPYDFFSKLPLTISDNFEFIPLFFFHNGTFYPDYNVFIRKYTEFQTVYERRVNIIQKPSSVDLSIIKATINISNNILFNIIRICTRLQ